MNMSLSSVGLWHVYQKEAGGFSSLHPKGGKEKKKWRRPWGIALHSTVWWRETKPLYAFMSFMLFELKGSLEQERILLLWEVSLLCYPFGGCFFFLRKSWDTSVTEIIHPSINLLQFIQVWSKKEEVRNPRTKPQKFPSPATWMKNVQILVRMQSFQCRGSVALLRAHEIVFRLFQFLFSPSRNYMSVFSLDGVGRHYAITKWPNNSQFIYWSIKHMWWQVWSKKEEVPLSIIISHFFWI